MYSFFELVILILFGFTCSFVCSFGVVFGIEIAKFLIKKIKSKLSWNKNIEKYMAIKFSIEMQNELKDC